MKIDDPRLAQLIIELVDRRARALITLEGESHRYGIISAVDAVTGTASVLLGGSSTASPGFTFPPYLQPSVGDQVRVVVRGADRYIEADLDLAGASGGAPSAALLYGATWYKSATAISLTIDTETEVEDAFRVTYPGNPAMSGRYVVLRPWVDVSLTWSIANAEGGVFLYSNPASDDIGSGRIRWQRQRLPAAANTMTSYHIADNLHFPAASPVEFRIRLRMSATGTASIYANATARYVSRIGYAVIGYISTPPATIRRDPRPPPEPDETLPQPETKPKRKRADG